MNWNDSFLVAGIVSLFIACLLHEKKKQYSLALFILFVGGLFIRLFTAHLDPFLHDWDEKFHALVARNMMDKPFTPMLYTDTIVPRDYVSWTNNHIWLHKQPLFMWLMALSMKIFGINEFSIRYPSAVLGAIMPIILYRITYLMSRDRYWALFAGLIMCVSNYQLELISGFIGMDHNDVVFGFFVLASIWAYAEYTERPRWEFILLIGLFSGCAVLTKWLTGLVVFGGWFFNMLVNARTQNIRKELLNFCIAAGVCILVFGPWQLYILSEFPVEAKHEYGYNTKHLFEVVENHSGDNLFYYSKLSQYFGFYTWWLVIMGIFTFFFAAVKNKLLKSHLLFTIIVIYCFFSYVATTKLQSYLYVIAPIGFVLLSYAVLFLVRHLNFKPYSVYLICLLIVFHIFNYDGIRRYFHRNDDQYRQAKIRNTEVYKNTMKDLPKNVKYVFNLGEFSSVEFMFYNKGITAYDRHITEEEFNVFVRDKIPVAAFKNHGSAVLPAHIKDYDYVHIIDVDLGDM